MMGASSPRYIRRVQTMLTEQQYALLQAFAQDVKKPLSVVIREALERALIRGLEQQRRQEALNRLCSGATPIGEWPEMERQIEGRWEEHWDE